MVIIGETQIALREEIMNLSYLKTKRSMWLPILCIASLSSSFLIQSKARETHPSISTPCLSSDDRQFISQCLQEIKDCAKLLDTQIRNFFNRQHTETYQSHLQHLDTLIARIDTSLIKPLGTRANKNEIFNLAYEILTELKADLNDIVAVMKQNQASSLMLATALKQLSTTKFTTAKMTALEHKIKRLNALIDGANICEAGQLQNILITLFEQHPLKNMSGFQVLDCLRSRLNRR